MTWLTRTGIGVAVIAALALGRLVTDTWPTDELDIRSFVHAADVGDTARLRYADVTVTGVSTAETLEVRSSRVRTPGRWLVLDVTVVASRTPLATSPSFLLEDGAGRVHKPDNRSGYLWSHAPTGVPWHLQVAFELPQDTLAGSTLRVARAELDQRRDDVARIDLGISADHAEELWSTTASVRLLAPGLEER